MIDYPTTPQKPKLTSQEILQQTEEFLAKGGTITYLGTNIPCADLEEPYFRQVQRREIASARRQGR